MAVNLEAALDELYGAKPEDFVTVRKALAKKLGAKAGAALKKQRKPTLTAYALNQLARRHPDAIEDLVDAGRALVRAQRKALRGDAADVREAITRQRSVIRARMADVAKLAAELGVDAAHLPEIASALQAALVDPAIGEELEAGHLAKPPEAPTSFPLFGDVPARAPKKTAAPTRAASAAKKQAAANAAKKAAADAKAARVAATRREAHRKAQAEARRLEVIAASLAADAKKAVRAAEAAAKVAAAARKRADAG